MKYIDLMIIVLIVALLIIIVKLYLLNKQPKIKPQTEEQKKAQIIDNYKKTLLEQLEPFRDDKQKTLSIKRDFLKKISNELSKNIFFDNSQIKDIVKELSSL
jgi:hypothetical protein